MKFEDKVSATSKADAVAKLKATTSPVPPAVSACAIAAVEALEGAPSQVNVSLHGAWPSSVSISVSVPTN